VVPRIGELSTRRVTEAIAKLTESKLRICCQPKIKIRILLGYQPFLAKPSYTYLTIFYDDSHCPSAVRASEWPAVVSFRWFQRDTFATAQADYS